MQREIYRLRTSRQHLTDAVAPLAQRLLDAGVEFLSAARYDDQWPVNLQLAANRIRVAVKTCQ